jgi:hypothetical protein
VAHGLGEGHAEAFVVRGHDEHVGGAEIRLELGAGHRTGQVHGVLQSELGDESA